MHAMGKKALLRTVSLRSSQLLRCLQNGTETSSPSTTCNPGMLASQDLLFSQVPLRQQHSAVGMAGMEEMSKWQKFKWNVGMYGKLQVPNRQLKASGYNIYICCTDFIDFPTFVRDAGIPDTFTSWFLLLQVHIWLVHVKLSQMGKEGTLLKRYLIGSMWHGTERRLETFEDMLGSERRKALEKYYSAMIMSTLYFDEGLLGCDKTLANSLWIQLYGMSDSVDARHLALMVEYVRKQVHHLDHMSPDVIMKPGFVTFLPLHKDTVDQAKADQDLHILLSRT